MDWIKNNARKIIIAILICIMIACGMSSDQIIDLIRLVGDM